MPNYVERDGDWVLRAPGLLEDVTMYLFILPAQQVALTALCQKFVDTPSGGVVTATPRFPAFPFVMLVAADIVRGRSNHPGDQNKGFMSERDVGFFVPVNVVANGVPSTGHLLPYLYIDNLPALLIGREIYGFPKLLGRITMSHKPPFIDLATTVLPHFGADETAVERPLVTVRRTAAGADIPLLAGGPIATVTQAVMQLVLAALGLPIAQAVGFDRIAMIFLKQFRDAAVDGQACYQSLTRAEARITALRSVRFLGGNYEVRVRAPASVRIRQTLGLGPGPSYVPALALAAQLDFALPLGTKLWTA